MKLDRNIPGQEGEGKYALVLMRKLKLCEMGHTFGPRYTPEIQQAIDTLTREGILDYGGEKNDFFVIRLKDVHAAPALDAYARSARDSDPEYAAEIDGLADLARKHERRLPD